MKLSEMFRQGRVISKKAKLLVDLELDNGESMKAGGTGHLLLDYGGGYYHFENNDFACRVYENEVEII